MNGLFQKDLFLPSAPLYMPGEGKEHLYRNLFFLVLVSFLVKCLYLIPGIGDPAIYLRTDSYSYLLPARSLLHDFTYSTGIGSGLPATHRTPLYPLFLAGCLGIGRGSIFFCAIVSAWISSLTLIPLYLSARIFLKDSADRALR